MPSKSSNVAAIGIGNAGFLRPTLSSKSKAIKKNGVSLSQGSRQTRAGDDLSVVNIVKEQAPKFEVSGQIPILVSGPEGADDMKDFSSIHTEPIEQTRPLNVCSELNKELGSKTVHVQTSICDDLHKQIEELKSQQKDFMSRLSEDMHELESVNAKVTPKKLEREEHFRNCRISNLQENGVDTFINSNSPENELRMQHMVRKPVDGDSITSEDSFTLHGSVSSYDDHELKERWHRYKDVPSETSSKKVIKKLFSERERYKKKVRQLQTALHRLRKKNTISATRSPDIPSHDIMYFNADMIGEGCFRYVYSGTINKNQKCAIKKVIRPDIMSASDRSYLAAEAGLLMVLHHHNIVEVYGVSTSPLQPLILNELVNGTNLYDRLHACEASPLSPAEYYSTTRDIVVGMAYLHGQKPPVLHMNLRPCNILLDANGNAKVADFGFSKMRLDAGISNRANLCYLAPELLQFPVHLTTKLDVYSFAMILWEMASLQAPYSEKSTSEIIDLVCNGKRPCIPDGLPGRFPALISRCWDHSPMQRHSFKESIIVLETMTLCEEWEEEIRNLKLYRTDTKCLITSRDNESMIQKNASCPTSQSERDNKTADSSHTKLQQRISEALALETDMIAIGYVLPKNVVSRSRNYLQGFHVEAVDSDFSGRNNICEGASPERNSGNRQRAMKTSSMADSFQIPQRILHKYAISNCSRPNGAVRSSTARNLEAELSDPTFIMDRGRIGVDNLFGMQFPMNGGSMGPPDTRNKNEVAHEMQVDTKSKGSESVWKNTVKQLNDMDMTFVHQDLTAGTPMVVGSKTAGHMGNSVIQNAVEESSDSSQKKRQHATSSFSIPSSKNLRSEKNYSFGDRNDVGPSPFVEKLSTYVSEACEAESRNYDACYRGWPVNRVASSDQIKVQNVFDELRKRTGDCASSAWNESTESLRTGMLKYNEAKEEHERHGTRQSRDTSSSTLTENSFEESRQTGEFSMPMSSTKDIGHQSVHSESKNGQRISSVFNLAERENKSQSLSRHRQRNVLNKSKSWNKLKNSYSPEPLMPHPSQGVGLLQNMMPYSKSVISLPPTLEMRDKPSDFTTAVPAMQGVIVRESPSKNWYRKNDMKKMMKSEDDKCGGNTSPENGVALSVTEKKHLDRDVRSSNVLSSTNAEVDQTLRDTANELSAISKTLKAASNARNKDLRMCKQE